MEKPAKKAAKDDFFDEATDQPAPPAKKAAKGTKPAGKGASRPARIPPPPPEPGLPAEKAAPRPANELPPGKPSPIEAMLEAPKTPEEFWQVLDRDLRYGRVDDAKRTANEMMKLKELTPEKILELRERFGSGLLVRLQIDPTLATISKKLIDTANQAAHAKARDPNRIAEFIRALGKSASERAYAIDQLRLAGADAVPYLVRARKDRNLDQTGVTEAWRSLAPESWPAVVAVLDSGDPDLIAAAIDSLRALGVPKSAEALWYVMGSASFPAAIRSEAEAAIVALIGTPRGRLPSPARTLSEIADAYYRKTGQAESGQGQAVVWRWEGDHLVGRAEPAGRADEYFAARYAQQSLELDPNQELAGQVLLSLALERSVQRPGDEPLASGKASITELAVAAGPEAVARALERATLERRSDVVLGAVRSLGATGGEWSAGSRRAGIGTVAAALEYPDPRVQFAAAESLLLLHPDGHFPQANRVIQTLVRFAVVSGKKGVLAIDPNTGRGNRVSGELEPFGFDAYLAKSGKQGFQIAAERGDIDLILIDPDISNWGLDQTLANLRADSRTAAIPIVVFLSDRIEPRRETLTRRYPRLLMTKRFEDPQKLVRAVALGLEEANARALTKEERAEYQARALDWLLRLARGERAGMDLRPASAALERLLPEKGVGAKAAAILGELPDAAVQRKLAAVVVTQAQDPALRLAAANALARNIQRSSSTLDPTTRSQVLSAWDAAEDPALRQSLARLVGLLRPSRAELARRAIPARRPKPPARPAVPPPDAREIPDKASAPANKPEDVPKKTPSKKTEPKKDFFDDN